MAASTIQQQHWLFFLLFTNYFFCCFVGCCCATFNLILFLILISPKHWPGTPIMVELRKKEYTGYSLALCHSISVNTTQYHLFSSPSLPRESLSGNKVEVFVFVPILGALFSSIFILEYYHRTKLFSWLLVMHLLCHLLPAQAAFDFHIFDLMCCSEMSKAFLNSLPQV